MTREEAAAILKRSVEELNDVLDGVTMNECTEATIRRNIDAYSMAVDALLDKAGVPDINVGKSEPLTLDELRQMDGEPVWLNIAGGVWGLVDTSDFVAWLDRGGFVSLDRLSSGKVYRHKTEEDSDND